MRIYPIALYQVVEQMNRLIVSVFLHAVDPLHVRHIEHHKIALSSCLVVKKKKWMVAISLMKVRRIVPLMQSSCLKVNV